MITARRARRSVTAALPAWLAVVLAVCLAVPGVADDLAALAVALVFCLIQPVRLRRALSAWRGGKSHRASEVQS